MYQGYLIEFFGVDRFRDERVDVRLVLDVPLVVELFGDVRFSGKRESDVLRHAADACGE